eukprot:scaffold742_cov263-Pinguiococcus_pyrenoidosus.AAC.4
MRGCVRDDVRSLSLRPSGGSPDGSAGRSRLESLPKRSGGRRALKIISQRLILIAKRRDSMSADLSEESRHSCTKLRIYSYAFLTLLDVNLSAPLRALSGSVTFCRAIALGVPPKRSALRGPSADALCPSVTQRREARLRALWFAWRAQ